MRHCSSTHSFSYSLYDSFSISRSRLISCTRNSFDDPSFSCSFHVCIDRHNASSLPHVVLVSLCLPFASLSCHRHFQSTYILVTLAPLLRIISMSTASMSLSSPHALGSQLPGALVLSVEQSLFAAEDCAHYAPITCHP